MLSEEEKEGFSTLLGLLGREDLMSLCDTVSGKLLLPVTKQEAFEIIVRHSTSAEQLLGRKKLTFEILFRYLHHSNVGGITTQTLKAELITMILDLWRNKNIITQEQSQNQARGQQNVTVNHTTVINQDIKNVTIDGSGQVMAKEFIQWFYPLLNSLKDCEASEWGPQHFWPEACLSFNATNGLGQTFQERFEGAQATQEKLASLITQEGVMWNPNTTSEGYGGVISPHGLAEVMVCGTLHKPSNLDPAHQVVVGVFEQRFGLLRDVTDENRWKIKFCEVKTKITVNAVEDTQTALCEITSEEDVKEKL